jgi:hypothetical protein
LRAPCPHGFPSESNGASRCLARRDLSKGGLLAGFALAAGPLAASRITTPERGLDADWVSISTADGSIRAYRARPAWAADSGESDPARLAITGFCWSGRITWLYAAHNPRLPCRPPAHLPGPGSGRRLETDA